MFGVKHFTFALLFFSSLAHAEGGGGGAMSGAIMSVGMAAGQIGAAAAQADADKAVARTNAAAQVTMTGIQADTSKYMSDSQKEISLFNALVTKQMADSNNEYQTKNLESMIDFRKWSRMLDQQEARENRMMDYSLKLQDLQLKRELMKNEMALKQQQMSMQYMQAVGSTFSTGGPAKSSLSVSRTFSPNSLQASAETTQPARSPSSVSSSIAASLSQRTFTKPVDPQMRSIGSRISNLFSHSVASGSSRSFKRRTDLDVFQEQPRAIRSVSAGFEGQRHTPRTIHEGPVDPKRSHSGVRSFRPYDSESTQD